LSTEISQLHIENTKLSKEFAGVSQQLSDQTDQSIIAMQKETQILQDMEQLQQQKNNLENDLQNLKLQLQSKEDKLNSLQQEIDNLQIHHKSELELQTTKEKEESEKLHHTIEQLNLKLTQLDTQLKEKQSQTENLEKVVEEKVQENKTLLSKAEGLQENLSKESNTRMELEEERKRLEQLLKEQQNSWNTLHAEVKTLQLQKSQLELDLMKHRNESDKQKEALSLLEESFAKQSEDLVKTKTALTEVTQKYDQSESLRTKAVEELSAQLLTATSTNKELSDTILKLEELLRKAKVDTDAIKYQLCYWMALYVKLNAFSVGKVVNFDTEQMYRKIINYDVSKWPELMLAQAETTKEEEKDVQRAPESNS